MTITETEFTEVPQLSDKRSTKVEAPAWWTNYDEQRNGPKTEPLKRLPLNLKQAMLQRDKVPSWFQNYLDITGQGSGYA